jgi:arylsulfatase A-like enzyme
MITRSRRRTPVLLLALCWGWCASCEPPPQQHGKPPNVVCIVIDTLRADHLPFYGYPKDTAPFLGTLASGGVLFRHAHSPSSWTAPATASIFTSLHPFQHGVLTGLRASRRLRIEAHRIPDGLETMPELLRRHGYRTFGATDNLNICEEQGFAQGFDFFMNHQDETAQAVNDTVIGWTAEIAAATKYFLYVHYMDPHTPYRAWEDWCGEGDACAGRPVAAYDSEIHHVDGKIGELARHLRWDENTLVIVMSDHGEEFEDHGRTGHGHTLYGELINVPLLIHHPARWPGGRTISARVSTLDVLPTVADLVGAPPVAQHVGKSLVPLLDGSDGPDGTRALYSHLYQRRRGVVGTRGALLTRSVIRGDWKLIASDFGSMQLFNLASDPAERRDVLQTHPEIAASLESALTDLERSAPRYPGSRTEVVLSKEDDEKLRALGYVE